MAILRRINYRNQITIPPRLLRDAGLPEGGLCSIQVENGRIILEPKEIKDPEFDAKDWNALDKLVKRRLELKEFREYPSPKAAREHLRRLRK